MDICILGALAKHLKTRSVYLPSSLKFKYEKGGKRDMVNKTPNLCKAKNDVSHVVDFGSCESASQFQNNLHQFCKIQV